MLARHIKLPFGPLVGKGFANADHIDGRVRYPIDPQHIVHLPIVVASDVDTAEVQGCGDQIDILGQVAGLEEDEAVATPPVLERRALESAVTKIRRAASIARLA